MRRGATAAARPSGWRATTSAPAAAASRRNGEDAIAAGVFGVPTLVIDGKTLKSHATGASYQAAIDVVVDKVELSLDGRQVALRVTINGNGTVTYPTLDDQSLNAVELGQCLKSAARLMIFPKFKGDPFHVEVPLTLSN